MNRLIEFSLKNRMLMMALGILIMAAGYFSYKQLPIDAFPDVSPSLVQVFTETEGLAPEEIEKYVTFPVEAAMNGLPNLEKIRSVSRSPPPSMTALISILPGSWLTSVCRKHGSKYRKDLATRRWVLFPPEWGKYSFTIWRTPPDSIHLPN